MASPTRLSDCLAGSFDLFIGVPDSTIRPWVDDLVYRFRGAECVLAPREDVALALTVGHHLAGGRPLAFMGAQGLAAGMDALVSLLAAAGVPTVVLTARLDEGTVPEHKVALARGLETALRALGLRTSSPDTTQARELAEHLNRAQVDAEQHAVPHVVMAQSTAA